MDIITSRSQPLPIEETGLKNEENNCYINCVLQCLIHTIPLWQALSDETHLNESCSGNGCLQCCLWDFMNIPFGRKYNIELILDKLQVFSKNFERGKHEDAHEFLTSVLSFYGDLFQGVFNGHSSITVKCENCQTSSENTVVLNTFILEVEGETLEISLANFFKGKQPDARCSSCLQVTDMTKTTVLNILPSVITLVFKRFITRDDGNVEKNDKYISFPLDISFSEFMIEKDVEHRYCLYAFIEHHIGGLENGHYSAFIRVEQNKWYHFDDNKVTEILQRDVLVRKPYVLFYSQCEEGFYNTFLAKNSQSQGEMVLQPFKGLEPKRKEIYTLDERKELVCAMSMKQPHKRWMEVKNHNISNSKRSIQSLVAQWGIMLRLAMGDDDQKGIPDEVAFDVLSIELKTRRGDRPFREEMKKRVAVLQERIRRTSV